MTFRYPNWLAYSKFALALAMLVALYIGTNPKFWGWLLFLPLFLTIVYEGLRTYRYSLTVDDEFITVAGFSRGQYRISDISAINVWFAKGGRIAVLSIAGRKNLSFPSSLNKFDELVALLRTKTNLPAPAEES
jgi:hypothetical protein